MKRMNSSLHGTILALVATTVGPFAVYAQDVPRSLADPVVEQGGQQQVKVTFVKEGWRPTPIELWQGGIFFEALASGKPIWVLLDNGAEQSIIDTGLAKELGLQIRPSAGRMQTLSGAVSLQIVRDVDFEIPQQVKLRAHMNGAELSGISKQINRNIGIILGNEYLRNMAYYVDTKNMQIYFRNSGSITPKKNAVSIPIFDGNIIETAINGKPARLKLDLGYNGVAKLSPSAWSRLIPSDAATERSAAVDGGGRTSDIVIAKSMNLRVGSIDAVVPISGQQTEIAGSDGLIGVGFFRNFNTVFDTPASKLLLIPH